MNMKEITIDGLKALISLSGDDPTRTGMEETPNRFVKAFLEMCSGYKENPLDHLQKEFDLSDTGDGHTPYGGMIISKDIPFVSLCEHHMLPFHGTIHMGYIPGESGKVVGLSKLARMADGYARRFQVQERLTQQIGDGLQSLNPQGAIVVVQAQHACQCFRGVRKSGSMITSAVYGAFKEQPAREEFLTLLRL